MATSNEAIAKAYELLTRVNNLTFKHHMIAAPLKDRLEWLKRQGYFVLPSSLIEEGGAPMVTGQRIKAILPNNRAKNGSRPVKGYKSWRQKGDELKSTGCHQMAL